MIQGTVRPRLVPTVPLTVRNSIGQELAIEALVDTGCSGSLTLPSAVIARLGLPWRMRGSAVLANGKTEFFDIHAGVIIWDGKARNILIEAADTIPLVGMALIKGYDLSIRGEVGGKVRIKRIA
jgi:clan AA aspartic protease